MIDVLVSGAGGKMGGLSAATIAAQDDLRIVALVDPAQDRIAVDGPQFASISEALAETRPTVALEFSLPSVVFANAKTLLEAGVATVVGATGLSDQQFAELAALADDKQTALAVIPNFALGAVLLMRFAEIAAKHYEMAEIVELHGAAKVDAPSGTSLRTARLMNMGPRAGGSGDQPARGAVSDNVNIHSIRLPGLVAHQEVLFGGDDELLTIRHDSLSRRSFMAGVLLAVRGLPGRSGAVTGLEHFLD